VERVLVVGNAGAGKSRLSTELGTRLGLAVVHLDRLHWLPGWQPRTQADFAAAQRRALPPDGRWVADGNYLGTLPLRLPLVDTVIVLDLPTPLCLLRVVARTVRAGARPDLAPGCEEQLLRRGYPSFLRYVASFRQRMLPRVRATIAEHGASARVITLRRPAEVTALLASLAPAPVAAPA
jgi:adenylate kinase family enzyme